MSNVQLNSMTAFPDELKQLVNEALSEVRAHSEHALAPEQRQAIYAALATIDGSARGRLAVASAQRVLPIWQEAAALLIEALGDYRENIEDYAYIEAPARLLSLAEGVIAGTGDREAAMRVASDYWYIAGNVMEGAWEQQDTSMASAFAYNASLLALNEALGLGPSRSSKPYADEDENLPDTLRDTASAAVLAEAGAPWLDYSYPRKRLAFWEWWLLEALPASLA